MARAPEASGPAPTPLFQSSFGAGVLDPKLWYRSDLAKWHAGAAELENFFVHVQGGISNRPGTQYIGTAKFPSQAPKLIPFSFNDQQTYILEVGAGYIRFITQGAYLMSDGAPVEVETPYALADVFSLRWAQSNDVLTITHGSYPPADLSRTGLTSWTYTPETYGEGLSAPSFTSACAAVAGNAGNTGTTTGVSQVTYTYAVLAVSNVLDTKSLPSSTMTLTNYNIGYWQEYGNYNHLAWNAVTGATSYEVYRLYAGSLAFLGATTATAFDDQNIAADSTKGTPTFTNPFAGGNNPACVTYFQQRRVFAGSDGQPQTLWLSQTGNYTNFDVSVPVQDDDAITATIAGNQANIIRHLISVADLIVMTSGGAWKVSGGSNSTAVTPDALDAQPQVFVGAAFVQPIIVGFDILYVESHGSHVRDLSYNYYAAIYTGTDLSTLAESLFYGYTIDDWCFARSPFNIVWSIRSDGNLLGMTYLKEQDVYAWHAHSTTNGQFLSCATVPEPVFPPSVEDAVYFVVSRTIGGQVVNYIERMSTRLLGSTNTDNRFAWFLDAALQYDMAAPVSTVSGLNHLIGQTVNALVDGFPAIGLVVSSAGSVTLPRAGSVILVGLPITATAQTLPIDTGQPNTFGKRKRISRVYAFVQNTQGPQVSVDGTHFVPLKLIGTATGASSFLPTGLIQANLPPQQDQLGQVTFQQTLPLPCTIMGFDADTTVGQA